MILKGSKWSLKWSQNPHFCWYGPLGPPLRDLGGIWVRFLWYFDPIWRVLGRHFEIFRECLGVLDFVLLFLFVDCCLLFVCFLLSVFSCMLSVDCCLVSVWCLVSVVCCLQAVVGCLLSVVCCLLFVVCFLLSVVSCLLTVV